MAYICTRNAYVGEKMNGTRNYELIERRRVYRSRRRAKTTTRVGKTTAADGEVFGFGGELVPAAVHVQWPTISGGTCENNNNTAVSPPRGRPQVPSERRCWPPAVFDLFFFLFFITIISIIFFFNSDNGDIT